MLDPARPLAEILSTQTGLRLQDCRSSTLEAMLVEPGSADLLQTCGFAATDAMNESGANWIALSVDHSF